MKSKIGWCIVQSFRTLEDFIRFIEMHAESQHCSFRDSMAGLITWWENENKSEEIAMLEAALGEPRFDADSKEWL